MQEAAGRERIVVIDDDSTMRFSCRQILARSGFEVTTFEDGATGLAGVAELKPALALVDLKMPGLSGLEVIRRVLQIDPQLVVVVITGYATVDTAVEAMKSGAYDFLPKPFSPDELRMIVERGLERRRLQQESMRLEVERELLKRRFITFVSHQLQSPLSAIHQYLDVLQHLGETADAAERRREWLERCLRRTEDLQNIIRDWLTLARVEGGTLVGERRPLDLAPIIRNLLDANRTIADAAGVTLHAALSDGECIVAADANCAGVLFDNLMVNAIKYNRCGGSVTVSGWGAGGEVVVEVRDTGAGIAGRHLPFLFDEFFRVGEAGAQKVAGTGLGLPICRRIVLELGGSIEVESEEGAGSCFRVRLPGSGVARGETEAEPSRAGAALEAAGVP